MGNVDKHCPLWANISLLSDTFTELATQRNSRAVGYARPQCIKKE